MTKKHYHDTDLSTFDKVTFRFHVQGLRQSWPQLYAAVRKGRVSQFGLIELEKWRQALEQWRQGYLTRGDLWVLLAIEIWLYRLEQKLTAALPT